MSNYVIRLTNMCADSDQHFETVDILPLISTSPVAIILSLATSTLNSRYLLNFQWHHEVEGGTTYFYYSPLEICVFVVFQVCLLPREVSLSKGRREGHTEKDSVSPTSKLLWERKPEEDH